jgi:hypothetical protein
MHMLDDRPPTLNSLVVDVFTAAVTELAGNPTNPEQLATIETSINRLVMGTHWYAEFQHPTLGTCRIHSLSDLRQDDYVYAVRLASAQCRLLGVMTEMINEAIAQVVEQYYRTYPQYRRPGM